jgi:hypothetical protein
MRDRHGEEKNKRDRNIKKILILNLGVNVLITFDRSNMIFSLFLVFVSLVKVSTWGNYLEFTP